jgi:hypothetical protein
MKVHIKVYFTWFKISEHRYNIKYMTLNFWLYYIRSTGTIPVAKRYGHRLHSESKKDKRFITNVYHRPCYRNCSHSKRRNRECLHSLLGILQVFTFSKSSFNGLHRFMFQAYQCSSNSYLNSRTRHGM